VVFVTCANFWAKIIKKSSDGLLRGEICSVFWWIMAIFTVSMKGMDYKDVRRFRMCGLVALAIIAVGALSWGAAGCAQSAMASGLFAGSDSASTSDGVSVYSSDDSLVSMLLGEWPERDFRNHLGEMPGGGRRLRYKPVAAMGRVFNDSNYLQLQAATSIGVEPVATLRDAWRLRRPVVKVVSCGDYFVDTLTHSLPFLVPEAEALLRDIGRQFRDSLAARGGGDYRIKVTSLLRTPMTIAKLRRRNRNAVDSSAHQYGTTFDISYMKFICDSKRVPRTQADLKGLLAEILVNMRDSGRCYVKYERKQSCFHITARGETISNDGEKKEI